MWKSTPVTLRRRPPGALPAISGASHRSSRTARRPHALHLTVCTTHLRNKSHRSAVLRHAHPSCLHKRLLVQSLAIDEEGDVVARLTAEQEMHRCPERFPKDSERNIDGRSRCANYPATLHVLHAIHQLPDAVTSAGDQSNKKLSRIPNYPDQRELPA